VGILATLAREISLGAVLGYFEARRISSMALDEQPSDEDRRRAQRFRDAVRRLPESAGHAIVHRPAAGGPGNDGAGMGTD
jgi:hypothetical protein